MEFHPLLPDFGALVTGFDVTSGGANAEIAALRNAYERYSMLLFWGGGRILPEQHLALQHARPAALGTELPELVERARTRASARAA